MLKTDQSGFPEMSLLSYVVLWAQHISVSLACVPDVSGMARCQLYSKSGVSCTMRDAVSLSNESGSSGKRPRKVIPGVLRMG